MFLHCKLFIEIDWKVLFPRECIEKIVLKVPNIVLEELDDQKYEKKKAKQIIQKFREFEGKEFKSGIELQISMYIPNWDSLENDQRKILTEKKKDHHIIVEILNFKRENPQDDVYLITGDYGFSKLSASLGIKTIYWMEDQYEGILFEPKVPKEKILDLDIFIYHEKELYKGIEINIQPSPAELITFEKTDKDFNYVGKFSIADMMKSISAASASLFKAQKSDEKYQKEIEQYNKEINEYSKFRKIEFVLINHGNHPYTNIDIKIKTILESGFELIYEQDLPKPKIPEKVTNLLSSSILTPNVPIYNFKEPNIKYIRIGNTQGDKNNTWYFGYHIARLKHNDWTVLHYPLMIKIPDEPSADVITFECSFTQDEPIVLRPQNLKLYLKK